MIAALSLVWGGSFFFVGVAVKELPSLTIVFSRVAIAAMVMWIIISQLRVPIQFTLRIWSTFVIMGLLNNVVPFCLIVWGQHQIASGLASILNTTTPFFTVIVAHFWTADEKINIRKCIGIFLGFAGVSVMMGGNIFHSLGTDIIAQLAIVAAAFFYALAGVYGRRFKTMEIDPLMTATGQVTTSSLMLLPIMLIVDRPWETGLPSGPTMFSLIGLGVLSTAIAYILYFQILARAGATNLLIVTFLIPVSAIFLGIAFLGEILELRQIIGFIMIGAGLLFMATPAQNFLQVLFGSKNNR